MPGRVTIKDLARAAGVSTTTVSLALRDDARISQATRARVQAVAAQLGYSRDPALAALVALRDESSRCTCSPTHRPEGPLPHLGAGETQTPGVAAPSANRCA